MSTTIRGARRAASFVLRGVAVIGLLLVLAAGLGPRVLPIEVLYVRSGSMAPGMPVGSLAVFTQTPASALHVGDVIAFNRPDRPDEVVTHRIAGIEPGAGPDGMTQLVTKGDANDQPDPWRVMAAGSGWRRQLSVPFVGFALGYGRALLAVPLVLPVIVWGAVAFAVVSIWRRPPTVSPA